MTSPTFLLQSDPGGLPSAPGSGRARPVQGLRDRAPGAFLVSGPCLPCPAEYARAAGRVTENRKRNIS